MLGRRTRMSDTGGARTSYGYDLADRLTSVSAPSGRVIALVDDDAGQRTSVERLISALPSSAKLWVSKVHRRNFLQPR